MNAYTSESQAQAVRNQAAASANATGCQTHAVVNQAVVSANATGCQSLPVQNQTDPPVNFNDELALVIEQYLEEISRQSNSCQTPKQKIPCSDCGTLITPSYMTRHQKSVKCSGKQNLENKIECPNCGSYINKTYLEKHQKTKKCKKYNAHSSDSEYDSDSDNWLASGIEYGSTEWRRRADKRYTHTPGIRRNWDVLLYTSDSDTE